MQGFFQKQLNKLYSPVLYVLFVLSFLCQVEGDRVIFSVFSVCQQSRLNFIKLDAELMENVT